MKVLKREEFVYLQCQIKMSKNSMANLLYAAIVTQSRLVDFFGIGIYSLNRRQNSTNSVSIIVHIHPTQIKLFEEESEIVLMNPPTITMN